MGFRFSKDKTIFCVAILWIIAAIGVCVWVNIQNLRLWVDEGMLAYSIINRSLLELASTPLDWNQSAPIIYIYIVKVFSLILGNSEFVLRLPSLLSFCVLLLMFYYIVKNVFGHEYPILETAFLAGIPFIMGYAQEFKPYMIEATAVLGVFILYYQYKTEKITWYLFIIVSGLAIGLGNPVCFVLGAILLNEAISALKRRNSKELLQSVIGGIVILLLFLAYYFFWLRPVIHDGYMVEFWEDYRFLFSSKKLLWHNLQLISDVMKIFEDSWVFISAGVVISVLINLFYEHNQYIWVIVETFLVTFCASSMGMFPVKNRLYLFAYPLLCILFFHVFNRLWNKGKIENVIILTCAILLICSQGGIWKHLRKEHFIFPREEIRNSIQYVENNIKEDEKCYIYWHALPVFLYENGYDNTSIGPYKDNLIFGKGFFQSGDNREDVDTILAANKMYILISHKNTSGDRYNSMLIEANDYGNLEKIMDNYDTPLYYYTRDVKDGKFSAAIEVADVLSEGDICNALIRITNTGNACMNNGFEVITLRTKEDSGQDLVIPIAGELPIGETLEIPVHFKWNESTEKIELHLKREGKFWMDEQGVAPVTIYRYLTEDNMCETKR